MGFKQKMKNLLLKINPTYKKVDAVQKQLDATRQQVSAMQRQLSRIESNMANYHIQTRTMLWWLQTDEPANAQQAQKQFWIKYPKASGDMRIVQIANMYLMRKLKEICEANGLKFWLHGGTLIGAMRHNGCIPWDDDVDVAMMRKDIEKLLEVLDGNQEFKLNIYYHDDNTFSRGYQFKLASGEIPNFIDIFVFDYCNVETKQDISDHERRFSEARGSMIKEFINHKPRMVVEDIGCKHWGPFSKEDAEVADDMIDRALEKMGDITTGNSVYYAIDNYPFRYPVIPVERIFPTVEHEFDGVMYDIPNDPDLYLKGYGDYWQAPKDIESSAHFYYFEPHIDEIDEFLRKNNLYND